LDTVDVDQSELVGDELEVNGVDNGPYLPRSLASRKKIGLDLGGNGGKRVSVNQTKVGEEDSHEDRAPAKLVNSNLQCDRLSVSSRDLRVEPVVEVVTRRTVVEETES
jgi:hypothetical protein